MKKLIEQLLHSRAFEEVRVVDQIQLQIAVPLNDVQTKVELGLLTCWCDVLDRQSGNLDCGVIENENVEHYLDEWRVTQAPFGLKFLNELFKRHALIVDRIENSRTYSLQ